MKFAQALGNDLNTSMALTVLYDVLKAPISDATKRWLATDFDRVLSLDLVTEPMVQETPAIDAELEAISRKKSPSAPPLSRQGLCPGGRDPRRARGKGYPPKG